jgi:hypothetical protein
MRAQLEQMPESVSRKGAKRVKGAWTEADAPPVTREVGFHIVGLGMVPLSVELQHKVLDLILQLDAQCASNATSNPHLLLITSALQLQTQPPSTCDGFVQAMLRCSDLEASAVVNEFKLMLSYIEAAFFIEWWVTPLICATFISLTIFTGVKKTGSETKPATVHWPERREGSQ